MNYPYIPVQQFNRYLPPLSTNKGEVPPDPESGSVTGFR